MNPDPIHADRWKHRRAMAWIAFYAGITFPLLLLVSMFLEKQDALVQIAVPYLLFISSIVGAYIGFATIDDKWQKPNA